MIMSTKNQEISDSAKQKQLINLALQYNKILPVIRCFHCNKPLADDFQLIKDKSYAELIELFDTKLLLTRFCCKMAIQNTHSKLETLKHKDVTFEATKNQDDLVYKSEDEQYDTSENNSNADAN